MSYGKPFIKWVGGKTQLLSQIQANLPDNFNRTTYIEPFVGGGAMLFFMLQNYNIDRVIINDINQDLINAYRIIQHNPTELIEKLNRVQETYLRKSDEKRREYYYEMRTKFNNGRLKHIDRACYFIFLLKTCYNGLWRVNASGKLNTPAGKYANPLICDSDTIMADYELLQDVEIINGDFAETLQFADANSFCYIDSPYKPLTASASFTSYYKGGFDDNEQIRLKGFCDGLTDRGCLLMESNSDVMQVGSTFFDDLYADYNITRVMAKRSINSKADGRGEITEILIRNYY